MILSLHWKGFSWERWTCFLLGSLSHEELIWTDLALQPWNTYNWCDVMCSGIWWGRMHLEHLPLEVFQSGPTRPPRVGVGLAIGIIHPSRPGSDSGSSGSNSDVAQVRSMRGTPRPDEWNYVWSFSLQICWKGDRKDNDDNKCVNVMLIIEKKCF